MPSPVTRILVAAAAVASVAAPPALLAATEERLSKTEIVKLNECMAMTPEALAGDGQCSSVMKKASLTKADIEKMRRCESKFNVEVNKDPDCAAMIKKHPELVRGHGSLMPEDNKPAPK